MAFFSGTHRIIAASTFYEGAVSDSRMLDNEHLDTYIPERWDYE